MLKLQDEQLNEGKEVTTYSIPFSVILINERLATSSSNSSSLCVALDLALRCCNRLRNSWRRQPTSINLLTKSSGVQDPSQARKR